MSVLSYASYPSFHHVTLPDSSSIEDAVRVVLSNRGRVDSSTSSASYIASRIAELTGAADVGSLRRLTDGDWRAMELPAMAALYLKYAMRQTSRGTPSLLLSPPPSSPTHPYSSPTSTASSPATFPTSSSFTTNFPSPTASPTTTTTTTTTTTSTPSPTFDPVLIDLQSEFQLRDPIDITAYSASLSVLQSMGFSRRESLEALLVTDNKGEDVAVNFLFADPQRQKKLKEDAKKRLATTQTQHSHIPAPHSRGASLSVPALVTGVGMGMGMGGGGVERLVLYRELVRGLLLDERLTKKSYDALKNEREKRKITKMEEKQILKELNITDDRWDKLRRNKGKPIDGSAVTAEGVDLDCVVCLDERKCFVCLPCGHVCMCEQCAESVVKSKGKDGAAPGACPMCHKAVEDKDCIRVYL